MKLKGKVALVTGGSRGIGRAVAVAFAKEGADVVVNYRTAKAEAEKTADLIHETGTKALVVQADVTRKDEVQDMTRRAASEFGQLDILVNNAGSIAPAMLSDLTEDKWERVLDVHLKGPFFCLQAAAPIFQKQNSGVIINVSSVAGVVGTTGQMHYAAAKGGVLSLTKSAARELVRRNVRVNAVCLGIIETDMTEKIRTDPKLKDVYSSRILMGRFGSAEEIAPVFVFLAGRDSSYITGQIFHVDGGYGLT